MKIEDWPIGRLTPYERNPRNNDESVDAVAASIREFGFRQPIVVDADGVIIVGHTRLKAAQRLEMATVPVHVARDLTPAQARALRLADNKAGELAEWDLELLPIEIRALLGDGVDLRDFGFDLGTLEELAHATRGGGQTAPDVPAAPELGDAAVTQPGDLWTLGRHRLLCDLASDDAEIERLMGTHKAALVQFDVSGREPHRHETLLLGATLVNMRPAMAPHAAIYLWHADTQCRAIQALWETQGLLDHQSIVWVRPDAPTDTRCWPTRHLSCMMGWVQGSKPAHDGDHSMETSSVWELGWDGDESDAARHPSQRPVELFARPMRKHTRPGQICLDLACGIGTQLIAGEREGRRVFGIEADAAMVDVAVRRWEAFTGEKATRVNHAGRRQRGMPKRRSTP